MHESFEKRCSTIKRLVQDLIFYQSEFDKINQEFYTHSSRINSQISASADSVALINKNSAEVNIQIMELSNFCQECKPVKKKK